MRKAGRSFRQKIGVLLAAILTVWSISGCGSSEYYIDDVLILLSEELEQITEQISDPAAEQTLPRDGEYTSKEDVALYLYLYGELPSNFITKKEASALGWEGGSLEPYAPGKSIGGDYFGNYEGKLPQKNGREYHECDIDTRGAKKRGSKRIVYSNDGLIYYTGDHYESYELLYGSE